MEPAESTVEDDGSIYGFSTDTQGVAVENPAGKLWTYRSKVGELYLRVVGMVTGYRTYMVGGAMVLRGVVALIDAAQGTTLSDLLKLLHHPGMDEINQGLAIMTLRAGMAAHAKEQMKVLVNGHGPAVEPPKP